jgi:hypothetical protein
MSEDSCWTAAHATVVSVVVTALATIGLTTAYILYPAIVAARFRPRCCAVEDIGWIGGSSSSSAGMPPTVPPILATVGTPIPTTTLTPNDDNNNPCPTVVAAHDVVVVLSVIIPSFNEELRLPVMLKESYEYLTSGTPLCQALLDLVQALDGSSCSAAASDDDDDDDGHCVWAAGVTASTAAARQKEQQPAPIVAVEWIVVDDGSTDQTGQAFRDFCQQKQKAAKNNADSLSMSNRNCTIIHNNNNNPRMLYKLVTLAQNAGKGAAVQAGMLLASGSFRLMVDADGATDFAVGLAAMTARVVQQHCCNNTTIWVGSRAHLHKDTLTAPPIQAADRSRVRRIVSAAFHGLRAICLGQTTTTIVDTQCGFKLFPAPAAQAIFTALHLQKWAFDIEVLYLALTLRYSVHEVTVPWQEIEGSKLNTSVWNLAMVSLAMLRDMICVRLCYLLNIWSPMDQGGMQAQPSRS